MLPQAALHNCSPLPFRVGLSVNTRPCSWKAVCCAEDTVVTKNVDCPLRDGVHILKYWKQIQALEFTVTVLAAFFFFLWAGDTQKIINKKV